MPFFDPQAMGTAIDEVMADTEALLHVAGHGRGVAGPGR